MTATTRHRELLARAGRAGDALELFAALSRGLHRSLPFDAAVWRTTDPLTGLTTAPMRVDNLTEEGCAVYWRDELLTETVNLFSDLARAPIPAAGLRENTGGLPARSSLYQDFMRPRGLDDELRVVLRADGRPWGSISLFRERGRPFFDHDDVRVIAELSVPLAQRLRSFARPSDSSRPAAGVGPGLLLLDAEGGLLSINDQAREHLADAPQGPAAHTGWGVDVPVWILTTALRARSLAAENQTGGARVRMRTSSGRWLVCHASCMRNVDGTLGPSAVVIESAVASEVVQLVMAAYRLSERELDITAAVARGLGTAEIAASLFISAHTVRDHLKAIFEKVQVSSRGELVARLFTDHYLPPLAQNTVRVMS